MPHLLLAHIPLLRLTAHPQLPPIVALRLPQPILHQAHRPTALTVLRQHQVIALLRQHLLTVLTAPLRLHRLTAQALTNLLRHLIIVLIVQQLLPIMVAHTLHHRHIALAPILLQRLLIVLRPPIVQLTLLDTLPHIHQLRTHLLPTQLLTSLRQHTQRPTYLRILLPQPTHRHTYLRIRLPQLTHRHIFLLTAQPEPTLILRLTLLPTQLVIQQHLPIDLVEFQLLQSTLLAA